MLDRRRRGRAEGRRAARITVPEAVAWRLFTKALPADEAAQVIAVEGDRALAAPALRAVAIVG